MTQPPIGINSEINGGGHQLCALIRPVVTQYRVVSFDIFDTLVERVIEPPDQVKQLAALQLIRSLFVEYSGSLSAADILLLRDVVEKELRAENARLGNDPECSFGSLASQLAASLHESLKTSHRGDHLLPSIDCLRDAIVESELIAERRVLRAKPGVAELLSSLRLGGARLIAVSDMYLDGPLVTKLLANLGLADLVDEIYVSADHGVGKYSGRLFRRIFEIESITPEQMLHIGDHPHSDHSVPLSLGSSSVLWRSKDHPTRLAVSVALRWLGRENAYWRGAHVLSVPPTREGGFFYQYGFNVLGPIYAAFVASAREKMISLGIDHAFFLARDGELFLQLHTQLDGEMHDHSPGPTSSYLHVSRKAVALPSMWQGISEHQLGLMLGRLRTEGISAIARTLDLPREPFIALAKRLGLSSDDTPLDSDRDWIRLIASDATIQDVIRSFATPARVLLRKYLEQQGFFGKDRKVALVDIGWNGSIQRGLRMTFADDPDWPRVFGLYLSFNDNLGHGLDTEESFGLLYDKRRMHPNHNVFEHFEEIFENGARALEATTTGYRQLDDGIVMPTLRDACASDRQAEMQFDRSAASLRNGAIAFGKLANARISNYAYSASDLHGYAISVAKRAVFFPSLEETQHLFQMVHTVDGGSGEVLTFSDHQLRGPLALLQPHRLLSALRKSEWKYGTGRSLGVPGFNHLLRLAHLALIFRGRHHHPREQDGPLARSRWWETIVLRIVERGGLPHLVRIRDFMRRPQ
jgi:FMN phosphatase YigB (HAD superfamily)